MNVCLAGEYIHIYIFIASKDILHYTAFKNILFIQFKKNK